MVSNSKVYLDYAAATPLDSRVSKVLASYYRDNFYNPSALYEPARRVKQDLELARHQISNILGARPSSVIFTTGATEANNLAIQGILKKYPGKVLVSAIEHESIAAPASATAKAVVICPVDGSGRVELDRLKLLIDDSVTLISIAYANHEIGAIQSIAKITALVKIIRAQRLKRRLPLPLFFHTDASQAAGLLDLHVNRLGVDLMTINGAKIYGPRQSGFLYIASGVELEPLIYGGGQEKGWRSGTENTATAIGLAKALELVQRDRRIEARRLANLKRQLSDGLSQVKGLKFNIDGRYQLPNILNFSIDGLKGETLVHYLDQRGFLVATGAACSANADKPSRVLSGLGLGPEVIDSSLRISMGKGTTAAELKQFTQVLTEVIDTLRRQS